MFQFCTWQNIPIVLVKMPHPLRQEIISGKSYIYIIVVTLLQELCIVSVLRFTCKTRLQLFRHDDENNKCTKCIKVSYIIVQISILNLCLHMCVSLHFYMGLMSVHVLLKIKICLQPFAVSRPISETKLYGWNLNINKYLIKYLTKLHAGTKAWKVKDKIIKKLRVRRVYKHSSQTLNSRSIYITVQIYSWKTLKEFKFV